MEVLDRKRKKNEQWNKLEDATAVGFKMEGIRWGKSAADLASASQRESAPIRSHLSPVQEPVCNRISITMLYSPKNITV
jgi:hypothetical protein